MNEQKQTSARKLFFEQLLHEWQELDHWRRASNNRNKQPRTPIINKLLRAAAVDLESRDHVRGKMFFRYRLAPGVFYRVHYAVTNLDRIAIDPPAGTTMCNAIASRVVLLSKPAAA